MRKRNLDLELSDILGNFLIEWMNDDTNRINNKKFVLKPPKIA